jgi:hypothetical protein
MMYVNDLHYFIVIIQYILDDKKSHCDAYERKIIYPN